MSLTKFLKNIRGVAAVEFALLAPILLLLFLGGFELSRYILLYQKVSKTASSMSDLISRSPNVTEAYISSTFNAVEHLFSPYYDQSQIKVIITSVMNDGTNDFVNWQRCGGGTLVATSGLGEVGDVASLPDGFELEGDEDTIIAEVFFDFVPIIAPDVVGPDVLYKIRFTKPRLGALITIDDDAGVTGC